MPPRKQKKGGSCASTPVKRAASSRKRDAPHTAQQSKKTDKITVLAPTDTASAPSSPQTQRYQLANADINKLIKLSQCSTTSAKDFEQLEAILKRHPNLHICPPRPAQTASVVHYAAAARNSALVRWMYERSFYMAALTYAPTTWPRTTPGLEGDVTLASGSTVLHIAVTNRDITLVKLLLHMSDLSFIRYRNMDEQSARDLVSVYKAKDDLAAQIADMIDQAFTKPISKAINIDELRSITEESSTDDDSDVVDVHETDTKAPSATAQEGATDAGMADASIAVDHVDPTASSAETAPPAAASGVETALPAAASAAETAPPAAASAAETAPPAAASAVETAPPAAASGAETAPPAAASGATTSWSAIAQGVSTSADALDVHECEVERTPEQLLASSDYGLNGGSATDKCFASPAAKRALFTSTSPDLSLSESALMRSPMDISSFLGEVEDATPKQPSCDVVPEQARSEAALSRCSSSSSSRRSSSSNSNSNSSNIAAAKSEANLQRALEAIPERLALLREYQRDAVPPSAGAQYFDAVLPGSVVSSSNQLNSYKFLPAVLWVFDEHLAHVMRQKPEVHQRYTPLLPHLVLSNPADGNCMFRSIMMANSSLQPDEQVTRMRELPRDELWALPATAKDRETERQAIASFRKESVEFILSNECE